MKHIQQKSTSICLVVLAMLALASCKTPAPAVPTAPAAPTVQVTTKVRYREASGRNIEPKQNAVVVPMVAQLEVISDKRIEYVETFNEMVTTDLIKDIAAYKRIALLNATKEYDADTMVAALINVETDASGHLVITVYGYPARYKNFRSMKKEDKWLLDIEGTDYNQSTQIVK